MLPLPAKSKSAEEKLIEKVFDAKDFEFCVHEDETIKENIDFITDKQWEDFTPRYIAMTGKVEDRPAVKLFRDIKSLKIGAIVKNRTNKEGWNLKTSDRYKKLLDERAKLWDKVEQSYVVKFAQTGIDRVPFYHDSTLNIFKVPLQFPTGFICQ